MGSHSFPRVVAGLITEDPDEVKEAPPESDPKQTSSKAKKPTNWGYEFIYEFEELFDDELLGPESMFSGKMVVGADHTEGEEAVMHLPNGDPGHPGSAGHWDWEITDVSDVSDDSGWGIEESVPVDLTDDLKKKLIDALHKNYPDQKMEELLDDDANAGHDPADRADDDYDRWKDEGRHEDY